MRSTRHTALLAVGALLASSGCRRLEPAPEDLDGLLHYLWQGYEAGEPAELAAAVDNLHALLGDAPLDRPVDGTTTPLTDDEVRIDGWAREPSPELAVGLYTASGYPCDIDLVRDIVISADQDTLYDGFDAYERVYLTDADAFVDGGADTLAWRTTYTVTVPLAGPYTAELDGRIRRLDDASWGRFYLSRSFLLEPATFDGDGPVFDEDYRIELFYVPTDGRIRHVEGLWRHMDAGLVDTDSTAVQRLVLDGLADWDARTAEWCEVGLPE